MEKTQAVLIVSTGRTGTIFFSKLFGDLYPEVASYHERGQSRPIQIATNLYYSGFIPIWLVEKTWETFKGKEIRTCKKAFHIDCNCFLYGLPSIAPNAYPNLKVIHIVRDPRTYVTSHLNFARYKFTSFVANHLVPFWQPNPFFIGDISWRRFLTLSRFEKYCWIWEFKNRIMDGHEQTAGSYLRIRFEDVFNPTTSEETFERITQFIGLSVKKEIAMRFSEPVNQAPKNIFPEWTFWTPEQCGKLERICGIRMLKYAYGQESEWLQKTNRL